MTHADALTTQRSGFCLFPRKKKPFEKLRRLCLFRGAVFSCRRECPSWTKPRRWWTSWRGGRRNKVRFWRPNNRRQIPPCRKSPPPCRCVSPGSERVYVGCTKRPAGLRARRKSCASLLLLPLPKSFFSLTGWERDDAAEGNSVILFWQRQFSGR